VKEWTGSEPGAFSNCVLIGRKLYIIGFVKVGNDYYGTIYVFVANLNILANIAGGDSSFYTSLAYDGRALYIGSLTAKDVDGDDENEWIWLVEKRDTISLSLIASREI